VKPSCRPGGSPLGPGLPAARLRKWIARHAESPNILGSALTGSFGEVSFQELVHRERDAVESSAWDGQRVPVPRAAQIGQTPPYGVTSMHSVRSEIPSQQQDTLAPQQRNPPPMSTEPSRYSCRLGTWSPARSRPHTHRNWPSRSAR
jgi:hypothetical protein